MDVDIRLNINNNTFLKNPESTEIGRKIIFSSVNLISELGYEHFTFKKLAVEINSTEATIYRYFENKHRVLLYIMEMYWSYVHFHVIMSIKNLTLADQKIIKVIDLLVWEDNEEFVFGGLNPKALYNICLTDGSKSFLLKEVDHLNNQKLFKPYKDLVEIISNLFKEYNPSYPYPKSLASSLIEISHLQLFFTHHLPRLTDFTIDKNPKTLEKFLESFVFGALNFSK
jgi:AcrR family transcriptional regulator